MKECEDCGCKMYNGACTNCHEEIYIQEQYEELEMEVPDLILEKNKKHRDYARGKKINPSYKMEAVVKLAKKG